MTLFSCYQGPGRAAPMLVWLIVLFFFGWGWGTQITHSIQTDIRNTGLNQPLGSFTEFSIVFLIYLEGTCHLSSSTCHLSSVTCHLSTVTCHLTTTLFSFSCYKSPSRFDGVGVGGLMIDREK